MTQATRNPNSTAADGEAIRPFQVEVREEDLDDLRRRLRATRWPEKETVGDLTQGVPLATMQELVRYWATDYDLRRFEARLNAVPQFQTEIDGLDIHFLHVRSPHPDALPVIITHGWPGSIIEMLGVIGPLTDPTAHGGGAADAFDVVVPSMPGYGFSAKPTAKGWDPVHIADAWIVLMRRLGYTRYVAQGGDWGAQITDVIGAKAPPELLGIHSNMPGTVPPDVSRALTSNVFGTGHPAPTGLSADEQRAYDRLAFLFTRGVGYARRDGESPADAVRAGRFARGPRRPGCSTTTRTASRTSPLAFDGRRRRQPHPGRGPRQHHDDVGHEHGRVLGPPVRREHARLLRRQGRQGPGGRERLPARALPGAAELDRAGLPEADLLPRSRQGQPLRGLAGARAVRRGAPGGIQVAPHGELMTIRSIAHRLAGEAVPLPVEGQLASFDGATSWLNSEPLTPEALRGRVVLVDFWTYTCVNWLRTLPYIRAWATKYADAGLTVIGVHTPEFGFEQDLENVVAQSRRLAVGYPVAVDSDYGVWRAFDNHFWPAVYLADAEGRIRFHHFGEGEYAMTEMVIQQLLIEAGAEMASTRTSSMSIRAVSRWPPTGGRCSRPRRTPATARPRASRRRASLGPTSPTTTTRRTGSRSTPGGSAGRGTSRATP